MVPGEGYFLKTKFMEVITLIELKWVQLEYFNIYMGDGYLKPWVLLITFSHKWKVKYFVSLLVYRIFFFFIHIQILVKSC